MTGSYGGKQREYEQKESYARFKYKEKMIE
jgi:hypothetical protein